MADLLNEALLKLISLTFRFFQLTLSLVIIGCMSQFLTTLSDHDLALPATHVAVLAISGVGAVWSLVALLLTCCAGKIMLEIEATMDVICMGMSIAQAAVLSKEATCTRWAFMQAYMFWVDDMWVGYLPDRKLIKASFGCAIVNVILYAATGLMSWAVFEMRRRNERHERHHHVTK
ncbi:hypothetical protein B0T16DRAFT_450568 [Cercophora newfieldiana]|uniref:MARVEL domain-containing protein n=1 Tax=Cercophora newfieldiana TaxID=92897 RepID=A0AA39YPE9_9PEZI|nr:hypothetical protein B0T16DRAFT_450568 [Cercophora newfieldiana]